MNREGSLLRIEGGPEHRERIIEIVVETFSQMGYVAAEIDQPGQKVSRWYPYEEIDELSAEEAKVLAERWSREVRETKLLQASEENLEALLEGMLLSVFREAARTGTVKLGEKDLERTVLAETGPQNLEPIREWLVKKLGGGHLQAD